MGDFMTIINSLLLTLPVILVVIAVHEYAHALVATLLGDPTPKQQGRLTLNPIDHIDPIGLIMLIFFRFGWARPVPINPRYFREPRKGAAMVAAAGPLANFTFAFLLSLLTRYVTVYLGPLSLVFDNIIYYAVFINIALGVFNLIPIPPLDGAHILEYYLGPRHDATFEAMERYGILLLIMILWFPWTMHILSWIVNFLYRLIYL